MLAILMILVNKAVFTRLHFNFPIALTTVHYAFTWLGLELLQDGHMYIANSLQIKNAPHPI